LQQKPTANKRVTPRHAATPNSRKRPAKFLFGV
jgi:hypothetical protein